MSATEVQPQPTVTRTFAEAMGSLRTALPGWEPRAQQTELAGAIETWMKTPVPPDSEPTTMFAQAPCGVGKSLAYLIPAIQSGKRVVVSVTTKALQDQLSGTDLPFLAEHLGSFTYAVLKGRSSYFCSKRAMGATDLPSQAALLQWASTPEAEASEGYRTDLPVVLTDVEWFQVASESDECSALGCDASTCWAEKARARARNARIVVVNHALFFTDLMIRQLVPMDNFPGMLGLYDMVIMDEAHEAGQVAIDSLATSLTEGSFASLASQVRNWATRFAPQATEDILAPLVSTMLIQSRDMFQALPGEPGVSRRLHIADLVEHSDVMIELTTTMGRIGSILSNSPLAPGADAIYGTARKRALTSRALGAVGKMTSIISDEMTDTVRWVDVKKNWKGQSVKSLNSSPVEVSDYLHEALFSKFPVLAVSATLAVGNKFDFIAEQIGARNFTGKIVGSPFDFQTQARLYIASKLPNPTGKGAAEWEAAARIEILELVRAAQGRSLILFSSIRQMRSVRDFLANALPYPVKMQGDPGESTESLKRWFMEDVESVLLGTRSFFTGFDPKGEACSQVIIVKFPFPVPTDPMVEARGEAVQAKGKNPFFSLQVPETSLVVQQMAGRAVRHTTDRAVIAVLDPRAATKPYGQAMIRDLGSIPKVTTRDEVAEFHVSIREHFAALRSAS